MSVPVQQPLVLIVDDDATTRMMASEFLSQQGFKIVDAKDGPSALEVTAEVQPDLILLDVEMPGMDGFELCTILRQQAKYELTPILMLTGLDNDAAINRAYVVGATDFATKPINWSLLGHRLRYMHRASLSAAQLTREKLSYAAAQRIALLGNWQFDFSTQCTEWSDQLYRILGLIPGEATPSPSLMLKYVVAEDLENVQAWFLNARHSKEPSSIDHQITLADGSTRSVRQLVEPELDENGDVVRIQAVVQDFTERRKVEDKVRQLAYYDTLTDLPNRALFQDRLENGMQYSLRNDSVLSILYFDLDDFKRVNDTFGHAVGDELLKEVGRRLKDCLRTSVEAGDFELYSSTIARMGGDEFTLILNNIQGLERAEMLSEHVAKRIVEVVSEPFRFRGCELFTSPSIGIALFPRDGTCAETLLKNADMAMYEAKRVGKSGYRIHNEQIDARAEKRYLIDAQLRTALEKEEFFLVYQPQLDVSTGKIYAVEALLRWENDVLGTVSPQEFISIAEDNGLIVPIGEWVLRTACRQIRQWIDSAFSINTIAVNISALQFMRTDFTSIVCSALSESNVPAELLELEITETLLASDIDYAVDTLNKLIEIGVKLSIDDFGTGYSSLSQLKHFPIDRVKIDQSFVKNVTEDTNDAAITRAVIAMSKSMNIQVLAEGVETLEHLEFLKEHGCHEVQGYFLSQPKSADEIVSDMPELNRRLAELFYQEISSEFRKAS